MNKEFTREEAKEEGLERGSILCEGSYSKGLLVEAFLCLGRCRGLKHTPWTHRASIQPELGLQHLILDGLPLWPHGLPYGLPGWLQT